MQSLSVPGMFSFMNAIPEYDSVVKYLPEKNEKVTLDLESVFEWGTEK